MSSTEKVLALVLAAAAVLQATLPSAVAQPLPVLPGPGARVVDITSNLEVPMEVHCKGDNHDYGPRLILPRNTYEFIILQSSTAMYSCKFVFDDVLHTFDIYNEGRDGPCPVEGDHFRCNWFVKEGGPCLNSDDNCYFWN